MNKQLKKIVHIEVITISRKPNSRIVEYHGKDGKVFAYSTENQTHVSVIRNHKPMSVNVRKVLPHDMVMVEQY